MIALVLILQLTGYCSFAQKDSVRKYLDAELRFTSRKDATYGGMAVKKDDHWILYAAYPDTSLLLQVYFKDADLSIKDGVFILYYPKGMVAQSGQFKNNIPNGVWESWYTNRQHKDSGDIINNQLSGTWKHWFENGRLKSIQVYKKANDAVIPVAHDNSNLYKQPKGVMDGEQPEGKLEGASVFYFENGNKESEVAYDNDSLTGTCTFYRNNGLISTKETYSHGKVSALECYNEKGEYSGATCSILKMPVFINAVFTAQEYIVYQLHRDKNKDIKNEGEAEVSFVVSETGTIKNLVIKSSPDPALSSRITKIFSAMPAWSPAISHNRPIEYAMQLTIPFYRE